MAITIDGNPLGSGTPGPNSVGSLEIVDNDVQSIDIKDGTITANDLAAGVLDTGNQSRTTRHVNVSGGVLSSDDLITVDSSVGVITLTAPAAPADGLFFEVKRHTGNFGITVNGNGKLVDGVASKSFSNNKESLKFTYSSSLGEYVIG